MIPPMDDDLPRPRGDAASLLAKEDLSPYSQDELTERIALLEAENARCRQKKERAVNQRASADSLFKRSRVFGSNDPRPRGQ